MEDRLFFMDVLRHAGRAELSDFAGGSNAAMDAEQWEVAPYTESDLERQATALPDLLGADGGQIQRDVGNYLAGVNAYIAETRLDPSKLPGEYAALGHPEGPQPFKEADLIATASLVGGIFGKGGGEELAWSQVADALQKRFGKRKGLRAFRDFRSAQDPESPVTVRGKRFPYQRTPRRPRAVARPDRGSLKLHRIVAGRSGGSAPAAGASYQGAWYGYVRKDLRTILGRKVKGRYATRYCGGGKLRRCRGRLRSSLKAALSVPASELYGDDQICEDEGQAGDQTCYDAVRFRPVGGATQPLIPWINRPTYQKVNEIQSRVPR